MILVAYRHGLRASELTDLRWDQIDFTHGDPSRPPGQAGHAKPRTQSRGDELRALRRLQREQEPKSPFVFTSERDAPFTTAGFARMVERAGMRLRVRLQGPPPHAAPCLRLRAGQQGPRHAGAPSLPRAQEHPAHRALHRTGADAVQGLLAIGLSGSQGRLIDGCGPRCLEVT